MKGVDVILLAGDRGPGDPLAVAAQVPGKTLVPVGGRAMLCRVLEVLLAVDGVARIHVVIPDTAAHRAALEAAGEATRLRPVMAADSPARSVLRALEGIPADGPVLLTTADHPLLSAAMVEELLAGAAGDTDFAVALAPWPLVSRRFPGSRRTRYRCRDGDWCGTNLFLIANSRGRRLVDLWQQVERDRKRPWRVARLLGPVDLLLFLARRLTLADSLSRLSARLGIAIQAVPLHHPESAVDVDSAADLALVEQVLAARESRHAAT